MTMRKGIMSQEPQVVTEEDCKINWAGGKNGLFFRCYFCGYKFKPGDYIRWQYSNNIVGGSGNPLVCEKCDCPEEELLEKWKKMHEEAKSKFWWFTRD
jgi:hypothetical protein